MRGAPCELEGVPGASGGRAARSDSGLGGVYAPIEEFDEKYRGAVIFWKFDRERGRIVPSESWAMELPPYMQDLVDPGKVASDGWVFINSFNTERSWGGNAEGNPPMESGASQNDMDYLHIIPWRKAEQVARAGKTTTIAGMKVITLQTAIDEGLLTLRRVGVLNAMRGVTSVEEVLRITLDD